MTNRTNVPSFNQVMERAIDYKLTDAGLDISNEELRDEAFWDLLDSLVIDGIVKSIRYDEVNNKLILGLNYLY